MFDIGFIEILVIAVLGLLIIGPDKLPGAVRSGAKMWGRLKHVLTETRSEIEKQIGADEIRRELHNEKVLKALEKSKLKAEQEFEKLIQTKEDIENAPEEHPDEWYEDESEEELYNDYHKQAHESQEEVEQALSDKRSDTQVKQNVESASDQKSGS